MKKITKVMMAALMLFPLAGLVNAATPGFYVGGGAGYSNFDNFSDATKKGNGGLGGRLFAGYNFNKFFGLETAYTAYAKTTYIDNEYSTITFDYSLHGISLVGKGYLPLGDDSPFNLYALLGVTEMYGSGRVRLDGTALTSTSSTNATLATAGVGASYDITPHVTTSLEFDRTGSKGGNDNNIGIPATTFTMLGISYNFS